MTSDPEVRDFLWGIGGSLLCGLSLFYAINSVVVVTGIHDKRERLPRVGVEVTANVVRWNHSSRAHNSSVKLSYLYDGREYRPEIRCPVEPARTMRLRVDPRHPGEFVAENNSTDDSRSFFNSLLGIPFGLLFAFLGGVLAFAGFAGLREDRRATRKLRRYRARKGQAG
jgi:uncharacterized protein DUF3592